MDSSFEQEYFDALRAIEAAIVTAFADHPDAKDRHADAALNGLTRFYSAALKDKRPPNLKLKETERAFYDAIKAALETQMWDTAEQTISLEEAVDCLKRIQRSTRQMMKVGGQSGTKYLEFVRDYHARQNG